MAGINVDLKIDKCLQQIIDIFKRRHDRKEDFVKDVSDDLDAIHKIIMTLNNLFLALAGGFADKKITTNNKSLIKHVEETNKYLQRQDLLPHLEKGIGVIEAMAYNQDFKNKKYREIISALRSLKRRLEEYRKELGRGGITGVGMMKEWNLMTLCQKAYELTSGGGEIQYTIEEMAEQVLRNHDSDLSDNIYKLIGKINTLAKILII